MLMLSFRERNPSLLKTRNPYKLEWHDVWALPQRPGDWYMGREGEEIELVIGIDICSFGGSGFLNILSIFIDFYA